MRAHHIRFCGYKQKRRRPTKCYEDSKWKREHKGLIRLSALIYGVHLLTGFYCVRERCIVNRVWMWFEFNWTFNQINSDTVHFRISNKLYSTSENVAFKTEKNVVINFISCQMTIRHLMLHSSHKNMCIFYFSSVSFTRSWHFHL